MKNLKHVTFIVPIRIDSEDRLINYNIIIEYLTSLFKTNIIVCESDKESHEEKLKIHEDIKYIFHKTDDDYFHRTMILNLMTKESKTNIVCNYDTDVIFSEEQYIESIEAINNGDTLVFPYGGKFMSLPKEMFYLVKEKRINEIKESDMIMAHPNSLGGAFFFNKEKYTEAGLENENFISWGFEDNERVTRLIKLGHKISRVKGMLYHLDHDRTMNSAPNHLYYNNNISEFNKIQSMGISELKDYVSNWSWIK